MALNWKKQIFFDVFREIPRLEFFFAGRAVILEQGWKLFFFIHNSKIVKNCQKEESWNSSIKEMLKFLKIINKGNVGNLENHQQGNVKNLENHQQRKCWKSWKSSTKELLKILKIINKGNVTQQPCRGVEQEICSRLQQRWVPACKLILKLILFLKKVLTSTLQVDSQFFFSF